VTNITFIFETSPNTKPKEKKVGVMAYYIPTVWKSGEDTSPVSPTTLRPFVKQICWNAGWDVDDLLLVVASDLTDEQVDVATWRTELRSYGCKQSFRTQTHSLWVQNISNYSGNLNLINCFNFKRQVKETGTEYFLVRLLLQPIKT